MINFRALFAESADYERFTGTGAAKDVEALRHFEKLAHDIREAELFTRLRSLQKEYRILVVAEMWCPDCHRNLPAIDLVTRQAPAISLGVITREQAGQAFLAWISQDKIRIPFAVVLNSEYAPAGQFIERPQGAADEEGNLTDGYREGRMLTDTVREMATILFQAEEKMTCA